MCSPWLKLMALTPARGNENHKPCFGLITNGGSFVFLKLVVNGTPQYSMSRVFDLVNPGNDLYSVLGVLKKIRQFFLET
jgi:hypothetical protein